MAKNNNLTDFLTGVADAIRAKKGTTDLINPQNFESEIASITTEKPEQEKSVTVTTNGTTEVAPDSGKALSKVTVTTNVQPTLQQKTVTPTTSQQNVTPDSGKDGLSKVTVNPVTSAIDSNIVAENIKKDVTILGVTGTLESGGGGSSGTPIDVATEEEMASILSNATADDNGKIYRYTGTTGTYMNGALYWLEVPQEPIEQSYTVTFGKGTYGIEIDGVSHDDYVGSEVGKTITLQGNHTINVHDIGADSCFRVNGVEYHSSTNVDIRNQNIVIEEIGYCHGIHLLITALTGNN